MDGKKINTTARKLPASLKSTAAAVFIITVLITIIVHILTGNFYTVYNMGTFLRSTSISTVSYTHLDVYKRQRHEYCYGEGVQPAGIRPGGCY